MSEERFGIRNLVIETTRRCNLECAHCLRGNAEALDMNMRYVNQVLRHIKTIDTISTGGGEPSFAPQVIHRLVKALRKNDVFVDSMYVVTNAECISQSFINALKALYRYVDGCGGSHEISQIAWSNDQYHNGNREKWKLEQAFEDEVFDHQDLLYPKWGDAQRQADWTVRLQHDRIIRSGRGVAIGGREVHVSPFFWSDREQTYLDDVNLYINCDGNVLADCDLSYIRQRNPKHIICRASEFSREAINRFIDRMGWPLYADE